MRLLDLYDNLYTISRSVDELFLERTVSALSATICSLTVRHVTALT